MDLKPIRLRDQFERTVDERPNNWTFRSVPNYLKMRTNPRTAKSDLKAKKMNVKFLDTRPQKQQQERTYPSQQELILLKARLQLKKRCWIRCVTTERRRILLGFYCIRLI